MVSRTPHPPVVRSPHNPILTPASVPASRPELEVVGVFNPGAIVIDETTWLILRVAEAPRDVAPAQVAAPVFDANTGALRVERWDRDAPGVDVSDPRVIEVGGDTYLTSISHLRLAQSRDGFHFEVAPEPLLVAATPDESFGIEDPRVVVIDGTVVVNYSAVSSRGISTAIATGPDLRSLVRRGLAFAPNNRDVTLFPERIGGRYAALHRPMPHGLGRPDIWFATSPDLLAWGDHRHLAGNRRGAWDDLKVGGGAPPIRLAEGWLCIYHGVTAEPPTYALGALLLDEHDPSRILGRSRAPILAPEAPYERHGFYGNVVFTCGAVLSAGGDAIRVYYGAADAVIAVADLGLDAILGGLQ